jgi:hypothetical protein
MPRRLPMGASPRHDGVDLGQTSVVRGARRLAIICSRGNTDESLVKTLQKEAAADRFRGKRVADRQGRRDRRAGAVTAPTMVSESLRPCGRAPQFYDRALGLSFTPL